jgi:hypothetical protein
MGGSKYIGGGRCCGRGSIWYSCALREKGVNCPVICGWLPAACCISCCRNIVHKHLDWEVLYNGGPSPCYRQAIDCSTCTVKRRVSYAPEAAYYHCPRLLKTLFSRCNTH